MPRNCTGADSIQACIVEPLQPARIAARRDSDRHLPAAKKEITGRGTRVVEGTVGMLRHDTITRKCRLFLTHQVSQYAPVKSTGMPFTRIVSLYGRYIQTAIDTCDRAVTKER